MKPLLLLLFFLPVYFASFSQEFMLDKKSHVKKKMAKFYIENKRTYSLSETDTSQTYILNDSLSLPATTVFYFNKQNRCEKQETIFSCDSCLQQSMQRSLSNRFINWKKAGTNSYYAGFPYNALMEQVVVNGKYILRFTRIKRKELKVEASD
jgi:hypothetical protein